MTFLWAGWAILRGSFALQIATAGLVAYGAWKANNAYQRHLGAKAEIARAEKAGKVADEKADKAHDAATRPGAAGRLLKSSCRDC